MYKLNDPYFKQLLLVVLKLIVIVFFMWCAQEITSMFIDQDIADYIKDNGVQPTNEDYVQLREKSSVKRLLTLALFGVIIQTFSHKFLFKKKTK